MKFGVLSVTSREYIPEFQIPIFPCTATPFVMKANVLISNRVLILILVSFKLTFNFHMCHSIIV